MSTPNGPSLLLEFDYMLTLPLLYVALTVRFALVGRSVTVKPCTLYFTHGAGGTEHLGKIQFESHHSQEFVCFSNLYLESQFVHNMFQGMLRSQFLHVSSQFVASKAVRAGHHKLIASHSLKQPETSQDCHFEGFRLKSKLYLRQ